jgi:hypothetical protein
MVTRWARRPVTVTGVLVAATRWRSGLQTAGRFAPFCAPALLLLRRPADLHDAVLEATYFGIGLYVDHGEELEECARPRPFVQRRITAAGWRFAEQAYAALTGSKPAGVVGAGSPTGKVAHCCSGSGRLNALG